MGKNISSNISQNLRSTWSQKPFDHTKQSATDSLKTASIRVILKNSKSNLASNKTAN